MIDIDKWQEIFHVLRSNKMRTFLTAFGVFWGIFMLVIMLGAGNGLQNAALGNFSDFATNTAFFWGGQTNVAIDGLKKNRHIEFNNDDITAIKQSVKSIHYVCPRLYIMSWRNGATSNLVMHKLNKGTFEIVGDVPDWYLVSPVKLDKGRLINEYDILNKRKVAIITDVVRDKLFKIGEDPINQYIQINNIYFQVIGVTISGSQRGWTSNELVTVPITTLQKVFNMKDLIDNISITAFPDEDIKIAENSVLTLLRKRHHVAENDFQGIGHFNLGEHFNKMKSIFTGINVLLWIVGIGTLLSGMIGVSNIMLIVVKERTREIGIRRALGAKPKIIINQIITEAIFLSSFAGLLGMSLGVFILEGVNKMLSNAPSENAALKNPTIDFTSVSIALLILILAGLIAGYVPARKAIKIKPIDALRYE